MSIPTKSQAVLGHRLHLALVGAHLLLATMGLSQLPSSAFSELHYGLLKSQMASLYLTDLVRNMSNDFNSMQKAAFLKLPRVYLLTCL